MKERPILFSTKMVQAILAHRKTQTRRIATKDRCPYGAPGDRLWVKETWGLHSYGDETDWARYSVRGCSEAEIVAQYKLTRRADWGPLQEGCYWRPAIFMPRWASRITLGVVSTRKEPLQAIAEEDARAEGVLPFFEVYDCISRDQVICDRELARDYPYRASFACLWDEINGDRALWNSNPDVWRVEFGVLATERVRTEAA